MRRVTLFVAFALALAFTASPVLAAKPTITEVNETFQDEFLTEICGFPVTITITGLLVTRVREGGNLAITFATTGANFRITLTGPTGNSIVQKIAGLDELTFTATSITFKFSGLGTFLVIPGTGVVQISAGRFSSTVIFDPVTGEIVDETFSFRGREVFNLSEERICELLAP
jgi:hypothetical protein